MSDFFTGNVTGHNKSKDKTRHHKTKSRQRKGKKAKKAHEKPPNGYNVIRKEKHEKRDKDSKEEEQESENDEDLGRKESYTIFPRETPRKTIKHRDMDEVEMKKIVAKFKPKPEPPPLISEKDKILMDRIIKKKYPVKYAKTEKWKTMMADEDNNNTFFGISKGQSVSAIVPEDSYEHVPKLAQVMGMREEEVFGVGSRRPFWMEKVEPDDDDMKDTEPAISVGTEHIEQYQDKSFSLKAARDTELFLDEFAPLATLQAHDEVHFHDHLVFSNTMRSLVNVQAELVHHHHHRKSKSVSGEEATQGGEGLVKATISEKKPRYFKYSRIEPILSVRHGLAEPPSPTPSRVSTKSRSGSGSGSEIHLH